MSLSSIARQNRRMRLRQLPTLNLNPPLVLSPNSLKSNLSNLTSFDVSNDCTLPVKNDNIKEVIQQNSDVIATPFPSTTGCSFVNCDVSSRPVGKVFIEEERGFKVIDAHQMQLFNNGFQQTDLSCTESAITLAYKAAKVFHNFSFFCHGILGGMSLLHLMFLIYIITGDLSFSETIKHFSFLSQPIHNIYNFFCIICCISAFDRFDIGNIMNLLECVKKCQLSVCIIFIYPLCLLMSFSTINVDEKFWLPNANITNWETFTSKDTTNEVFYWKTLSILKCVGAVIAWIVMCWKPNYNLFLNQLKDICKRNKDGGN